MRRRPGLQDKREDAAQELQTRCSWTTKRGNDPGWKTCAMAQQIIVQQSGRPMKGKELMKWLFDLEQPFKPPARVSDGAPN